MRSRNEFKAELFRRCAAYEAQKRKRRRKLVSFGASAAACLVLTLALGSSGLLPRLAKSQTGESATYTQTCVQTQLITEKASAHDAVSVEVRSGASVSRYTDAEKIGKILSTLSDLTLSGVPQKTETQAETLPSLVITVAYSDGDSRTFTLSNGVYLSGDDGSVREISPSEAERLKELIAGLAPD